MVAHLAQMMRMTSEEATAFMAINQSVLEPFLCGVSPPRPPTPPTPEPLMVPPCYNNLSPEALDYELVDSEVFPLPPLLPRATSPAETHIFYPPSLIHNSADDLDKFPDSEWPSNPPSPTPPSDNVPVLQAFIQMADNPVETRV